MIHEIESILVFFGFSWVLSLLCFPVSFLIFSNLKDRGYAFTKVISLSLFSYASLAMWFLGVTKQSLRDFLALTTFLCISAVLFSRVRRELLSFLKEKVKIIIITETLFLSLLLLATLIKSGAPDILINSDKFLDFSIYNRLMLEEKFPPLSSWLSGENLNYHWGGHYIFALISRFAGVSPEYGINLSMILIFAITFVAAFSIGYNLLNSVGGGILGALGICFLSHMGGLFKLIQSSQDINWSSILILKEGTINNFPFFAFLIGDLHSQVITLPFLLFVLAWALNLYKSNGAEISSRIQISKNSIVSLLVIAITLGLILVSNVFDYPVALLFVLSPIFYLCLNKSTSFLNGFLRGTIVFSAIIIGSILLISPILFYYEVPSYGIKVVPSELVSDPPYFLTVFGFPLVFFSIYISREVNQIKFSRAYFIPILAVLALILLFALWRPAIVPITLVILFTISFYLFILKKWRDPILLFISIIIILLLLCELVYLNDIFRGAYERTNTVFKYHWTSLSLALLLSPIIAVEIFLNIQNRLMRVFIFVLTTIFFVASSIFTFYGTIDMNFNPRKDPALRKPTLNGMRYLEVFYPAEYEAIKWIRESTDPNDIILESTGDYHTFHSRFSTLTARPAVLGWGQLEKMIRPMSYHREIDSRRTNIDFIYTSMNKQSILHLLEKYKVDYIIVGTLENLKYPPDSLNAFDKTFFPVFRNAGVTIYKTYTGDGDNSRK